jgi:hypothetical protein
VKTSFFAETGFSSRLGHRRRRHSATAKSINLISRIFLPRPFWCLSYKIR